MKQKDYKKLSNEEMISIQEVIDLTHKSRTTAWRYMQILVECRVVEPVCNTNNMAYHKYTINNDYYNRLVYNDTSKISNYSKSDMSLAFFSYIAGGLEAI